jgi:Reverse transcriptase (RNA-dependent DNA polymerase)
LLCWGISERYIDAILRCYNGHKVQIALADGSLTMFELLRGILQGDTLAPYLFVLLLDAVLFVAIDPTLGIPIRYNALRTRKAGLRQLHSDTITDFDYADDIALCCESVVNAQTQLRNIEAAALKVGLKLNVGKNKTEFICLNTPSSTITLNSGASVSSCETYVYLGHRVGVVHQSDAAIATRSKVAWYALAKFKSIFKSKYVAISVKRMFATALINSSLLYGSGIWKSTVKQSQLVDRIGSAMLRYATQMYQGDTIYNDGLIPHFSSLVRKRRIISAGHAIRHEMLGVVLSRVLPPCLKVQDRHRTYVQQLEMDTGLTRSELVGTATYTKAQWVTIAVRACRDAEVALWTQWLKRRRTRWTAVGRVEARTYLRILETPELFSHCQRRSLNFHVPAYLEEYRCLDILANVEKANSVSKAPLSRKRSGRTGEAVETDEQTAPQQPGTTGSRAIPARKKRPVYGTAGWAAAELERERRQGPAVYDARNF